MSRHRVLLDKLERTDVKESMDELLSEAEKREMAHLNKIVEIILVAEERVNELIVVLRDL